RPARRADARRRPALGGDPGAAARARRRGRHPRSARRPRVGPTGGAPARAGELLGRPVAVSHPFGSPADRPAAEAEARATLEAALLLDRPPRLARADRLAVYRMLGALHKLPDGHRLALAVLAPLLEARPDVRRERIETLRAILGHG